MSMDRHPSAEARPRLRHARIREEHDVIAPRHGSPGESWPSGAVTEEEGA
jgi:hypothetical protein